MRLAAIMLLGLVALPGGCCTTSNTGSSSASGGISGGFLSGWDTVTHATTDIDHDGTPEWFLGNPAMSGNAGTPYLVLKRHGEMWQPMGEIVLNPRVFRILPLAPDGSIRLRRYWHVSASEGIVHTLTHRDGRFVVIDDEIVHAGDGGTEEGRRRAAELFPDTDGPDQRLQLTDETREKR